MAFFSDKAPRIYPTQFTPSQQAALNALLADPRKAISDAVTQVMKDRKTLRGMTAEQRSHHGEALEIALGFVDSYLVAD
jgi:hypothetical protein